MPEEKDSDSDRRGGELAFPVRLILFLSFDILVMQLTFDLPNASSDLYLCALFPISAALSISSLSTSFSINFEIESFLLSLQLLPFLSLEVTLNSHNYASHCQSHRYLDKREAFHESRIETAWILVRSRWQSDKRHVLASRLASNEQRSSLERLGQRDATLGKKLD